jgi:hypothetical protein
MSSPTRAGAPPRGTASSGRGLAHTPIRGHEKEAFERLTGREPSASVLFASFSFPAFDLLEDVPDSGLAMGVAPPQRVPPRTLGGSSSTREWPA